MTSTTPYSFRFADIEVLRYRVEGFDSLPLDTKLFLYHLSEAALAGRDIIFAQHHRFNLPIRHLLDALVINEKGCDHPEYPALCTYAYRVWFASGVHHHYGEDKFVPECSKAYFTDAVGRLSADTRGVFAEAGLSLEALIDFIFDPQADAVRRAHGDDDTLIEHSSVNFYGQGVTTREANDYYESIADKYHIAPGLNSRLIKDASGSIVEETASTTGMYAQALQEVVAHLRKAADKAPSDEARAVIDHLVRYYETGDLDDFYEFSIRWVGHNDPSGIDFINGFIETYTDPLGLKGSWEAIVQLVDSEGSRRTALIAEHASRFEARSPIDEAHKKGDIQGVSASAINVVMLAGDSYPASPLGINLPNDERIRADFGSKSVTLTNISQALDEASMGSGATEAFYLGEEVRHRLYEYGSIASVVHTDLHECLGHGSGRLEEGVSGDALGAYDSTIEEARADLNALYFIADPEMVALGILPSSEAYKAEYDRYMTNGLIVQLARLKEGEPLKQAHMQNRSLITRYILAHTDESVVSLREEDGHFYVVISDYERLRGAFGEMLRLIQRVKSTGDIDTARTLVEMYGTTVDGRLYHSASTRYKALGLAPFKGFLNPRMTLVRESGSDSIADVRLDYDETFEQQMLRYGKEYSFLPLVSDSPKPHPDGRWKDTLNGLRVQFRRNMDGVVSESMRDKGVNYGINFGVTLPRLQTLAQTLPSDADLARRMWGKDVREMKLLAPLVFPPDVLDMDEALRMCHESPHIEVSEQLCLHLLMKVPFVEHLTLRLWQEGAPYTEQAAIIPYILMTRMLMQGGLGYQLRSELIRYASRDLTAPAGSLLMYMLNALRRLGESDDRGRALLTDFLKIHAGNSSPVISALRAECEDEI